MIDDMMIRNLSAATQQSYIYYAIAKLGGHFVVHRTVSAWRRCEFTSCT
jgi:hypothetical protein